MQKSRRKERREEYRRPVTILFALGCIFALVFIYFNVRPAYISWPLSLIILSMTGIVISTSNNFQGQLGFYMLGSRHGIGLVDGLSKRGRRFWEFFALWGLVLGFGVFAYFIPRHRMDKKVMALGLATLAFILLFVLPNLSVSLQFISIPQVTAASAGQQHSQVYTAVRLGAYILYGLGIIGGFSLFMFSLILYSAGSILYAVAVTLVGAATSHPNNAILGQQVPGVAPVIPGITIPFFSGLLALTVLLLVHEFSHGILARLYRIKIKRIGLIPFGIVPVGAFVEPDERQVERLDKDRQNNIFVAGIAANFLFMLIFFALLLTLDQLFTRVVVLATIPNTPAFNIIAPNSLILRWNGYAVGNTGSFLRAARNDTPNSNISILTNNGYYVLRANSTGKVGVMIGQQLVAGGGALANGFVNFAYEFFALSFTLNFLVATLNLLPVPVFDGWRIYKNAIGSRKAIRAISAFTVVMIIVLALPWLWIR